MSKPPPKTVEERKKERERLFRLMQAAVAGGETATPSPAEEAPETTQDEEVKDAEAPTTSPADVTEEETEAKATDETRDAARDAARGLLADPDDEATLGSQEGSISSQVMSALGGTGAGLKQRLKTTGLETTPEDGDKSVAAADTASGEEAISEARPAGDEETATEEAPPANSPIAGLGSSALQSSNMSQFQNSLMNSVRLRVFKEGQTQDDRRKIMCVLWVCCTICAILGLITSILIITIMVNIIHGDTGSLEIKIDLTSNRTNHNFQVNYTGSSSSDQAYDWIVNGDPFNVDPEDKYMPQRYALAVLWYATSDCGKGWINQENWMSEHGYCSWYGVKCVGLDQYFQLDGNGEIFEVNLTANGLRGYLPSELAFLTGLFTLHLGGNSLKGFIPTEFASLSYLRSFNLEDNIMVGDMPTYFLQMPQLRQLSLARNYLSGTIPTEIGHATKLRDLDLRDNKLTGVVPESMQALSRLETLQLAENQLSGTIPEAIFDMKRLEILDLTDNRLSGFIPNSLENLSHLELLHLDGNDFTGTIPDAFRKMGVLRNFKIHENWFTGTVPESIGYLKRMEYMSTHQNSLSGVMPESICNLKERNSLEFLSADCKGFKGAKAGVDCLCCNECH